MRPQKRPAPQPHPAVPTPTEPMTRRYSSVRLRTPIDAAAIGLRGTPVLQGLVVGQDGVRSLEMYGTMVRAVIDSEANPIVLWTVVDWGVEA